MSWSPSMTHQRVRHSLQRWSRLESQPSTHWSPFLEYRRNSMPVCGGTRARCFAVCSRSREQDFTWCFQATKVTYPNSGFYNRPNPSRIPTRTPPVKSSYRFGTRANASRNQNICDRFVASLASSTEWSLRIKPVYIKYNNNTTLRLRSMHAVRSRCRRHTDASCGRPAPSAPDSRSKSRTAGT